MISNLRNHGYERYRDLHIDHIDQAWKARDRWIEGAFEALRIAVESKKQHAPSFSVVLAIALASGEEPRGLDFHTLEEINAELGSSPPSLYLFQKGTEPWTKAALRDRSAVADEIVVEEMSPRILGGLGKGNPCYYIEFRQVEFKDYSRSILVAG